MGKPEPGPGREPSVTFALEIPMVPNYLRTIAGVTVPLRDVSDATLRQIGERWTEELLRKAHEPESSVSSPR